MLTITETNYTDELLSMLCIISIKFVMIMIHVGRTWTKRSIRRRQRRGHKFAGIQHDRSIALKNFEHPHSPAGMFAAAYSRMKSPRFELYCVFYVFAKFYIVWFWVYCWNRQIDSCKFYTQIYIYLRVFGNTKIQKENMFCPIFN